MSGLQCFVIGVALFTISTVFDLTPLQTIFATAGGFLWVGLAIAKQGMP